MINIEKVINGLECCMSEHICRGCPYKDKDECEDGGYYYSKAIEDALVLLKEQEAVEPVSYMDGPIQRFTCRKCGKHLLYAKWGRDNFCSKCGQKVKWE